jgi:hypothetical protein
VIRAAADFGAVRYTARNRRIAMPRSIRFALLAALVAAALTPVARAAQRPRITSRGTVDAAIDGVHIAMEYGRPTKRGRDIWGALVPWGRWWMPGADETTSIVTDGPLLVGTLAMPAGTHTIYTLPTADTFTLIINRQTGQFHTVPPRTRPGAGADDADKTR